MTPQAIVLLVATAAAFAGQGLDSYTSYEGIFVKKIATEGSTSFFAKLFTSNKYLCLLAKPSLVILITVAMLAAGFDGFALLGAAALQSTFAVLGFQAGRHNLAVNSAAKKV